MKKALIIIGVSLTIFFAGCEKDFLDKKPNKALLVPTTLNDFQALLDNNIVFNVNPALNIIAGDEYTVTNNGTGLNILQSNAYYWADDIYQAATVIADWDTPYKQVFYANIILDGLEKLDRNIDPARYDNIKGSALFVRSFAFYNLVQLFAQPYNMETATTIPAIPMPLSSDVNKRPGRGTLEQFYIQLASDLKTSAELLPLIASFKSRPSKWACFSLLARVYLTKQNYRNAFDYAEASLSINNNLIDYNSLDATASNPFPATLPNGNPEVSYNSENLSYAFVRSTVVKFSDDLTSAYEQGDLRKALYFIPSNGRFRGYVGIANDEVFLVRAESACRLGKLDVAGEDLNFLLVRRYKTGTFVPVQGLSQTELLNKILLERKKELVARGIRWTDLRRLNQEPLTAVTLKRKRDQAEIVLLPNSPKYTFLLPNTELGNGIEQNPR
ncbi:RagB/SusD family nutrient uptake outer membrane protein [Pedobacter caeni]|uniref:SusD family protein n=1 Tax=Pedobacter caeni TaxID=288992 RepID=A0A1M5GT75_9SPHI|nr:RagB/SusD family nutrient uptake outer membrane protein [Pedobacter caeni]SHG06994.1 SusD family protein [Pedobacter caeni]